MDNDLEVKQQKLVDEENKSTNLQQAKDRAQLTATTAMSIVHVALLREVLDQGPENNDYYIYSLVLIVISLILQIVAGLISLVISNMKTYYQLYKGACFDDVTANLCCCTLRSYDDRDTAPTIKQPAQTSSGGKSTQDKLKGNFRYTPFEERLDYLSLSSQTQNKSSCCPFYCTTSTYDEDEEEILRDYEEWKLTHPDIQLLAIEAQHELPHITEHTAQAQEALAELEKEKDSYQEDEFKKKTDEIQYVINQAVSRKKVYDEAQRLLTVSEARGVKLSEWSHVIERERLYKMTSFWQNVINYMLYSVFILNSFITGLAFSGTNTTVVKLDENVAEILNNNTTTL